MKTITEILLISTLLASRLALISGHLDLKGFDDTILFNLNWPGKTNDLIMDQSEEEPLIITTHNQEKYKCYIPNLYLTPSEPPTPYTGPGNKNSLKHRNNYQNNRFLQVLLISYQLYLVHQHVRIVLKVIGHTRCVTDIT